MDAQQGTYISPDGRHRWDPQGGRWVPVEAPAEVPAAAPAPQAWGSPAASQQAAAPGGWGRPVDPAPSRPARAWPPAPGPPAGSGAAAPWAQPAPAWPGHPAAPWTSTGSGYAPAGRVARVAGPAVGGVAAAVGGAGLVIGAFLAWITATSGGTSISQKGIDTPSGDGWFFVICGAAVVTAALLTLVGPSIWLAGLVAACALAAAGLTIYEFVDVHGHIIDAKAVLGQDVGSYGIGLYLLAVGSAIALLGGLAESVRGRRR